MLGPVPSSMPKPLHLLLVDVWLELPFQDIAATTSSFTTFYAFGMPCNVVGLNSVTEVASDAVIMRGLALTVVSGTEKVMACTAEGKLSAVYQSCTYLQPSQHRICL